MEALDGDTLSAAVAAELRGYRAAKQMTIEALAREAGISKRHLIRILKAETDIDVRTISLLMDALGEDPAQLMVRAVERTRHHGRIAQ